jgi:hypothetical protein
VGKKGEDLRADLEIGRLLRGKRIAGGYGVALICEPHYITRQHIWVWEEIGTNFCRGKIAKSSSRHKPRTRQDAAHNDRDGEEYAEERGRLCIRRSAWEKRYRGRSQQREEHILELGQLYGAVVLQVRIPFCPSAPC